MNYVRLFRRLSPFKSLCIPMSTSKLAKPNVVVPSLYDRTRYRLGMGNLRYTVAQLNVAGENMFAVCAEYPLFEDFTKHLDLPDTFQTWFSLTTLHMWLSLVRLRQEGVEGQLLKKTFINLFWIDLKSRMRTFKILMRQQHQVNAFQLQFFGSVFAYDEGLLSHSDTNLAAALWRNLFVSSPTTTFEQLELVVEYLRKNLAHLDDIPSSTILQFGTPTFLPLKGNQIDQRFANERIRYCVSWPDFVR